MTEIEELKNRIEVLESKVASFEETIAQSKETTENLMALTQEMGQIVAGNLKKALSHSLYAKK